jgi:type I site-specific restriction endonuclease
MRAINEDEAELVIEEHLRTQGWNLNNITLTRKRWREYLDGEEADQVFLHHGKIAAILEAKKPGQDLWGALDQAKHYARTYQRDTGQDILLLFASAGEIYLRQNLKANTLPERIDSFPTPTDLQDLLAMVAVPSAPYTEIVAVVHPRAADAEEGYARESP